MDKMKKARARMLLKHPFFATLMVMTPNKACTELPDGTPLPTAATDMKTLYWNPEFIESLEDDTVMFVIAHEVMHIALEHGVRLQGRNPIVFNYACDFAINLVLRKSGFAIWDKCLIDDKYEGMSADAIYELLMKDVEKARKAGQPSPFSGDGAGGMIGDIRVPDAANPAEMAKIRRETQQKVAQAATAARLAGKLGGDLERLVGEILDPKLPWRDLLRDYMTRSAADDESWNRRNRRFQNFYLPTRHSLRMGPMIFIPDTSGSMGPEELRTVCSEMAACAEQMNPDGIRVLWTDTRVAGEQEFEPGDFDYDKLVPAGGGGTDMRVGLKYAEQYEPQVVVLLTDGYTPWPDVEPPYPLIVCCTTDVDCPIGQVVRINQ